MAKERMKGKTVKIIKIKFLLSRPSQKISMQLHIIHDKIHDYKKTAYTAFTRTFILD